MRILFVAGGTVGPLAPLLAVAEAVRSRHADAFVHFVIGTSAAEARLLSEARFSYSTFRASKFRRYWDWRTVTDVLYFPVSIILAFALLVRLRPDVVATAGSYTAVPFVWMAKLLGKHVLVHQQDILPGLANRLAWRWADERTAAFPILSESSAAQWTGNPVRSAFHRADAAAGRAAYGLEDTLPLILILTGSSGALAVNTLVFQSVPALTAKATIVHSTGKHVAGTPPSADRYHPLPFIAKGMEHLMAAADLVVTRAGIGTMSELALLKKPCIIIPMPNTHQEANARYFAQKNAAIVLDQRTLTQERFVQTVTNLLEHPQERHALSDAIGHCNKPDAAERIATLLENLARHAHE